MRQHVKDGTGVLPGSIDETVHLLESEGYVTGRGLACAIYLALAMERPLFLEGEAGVGKTETAKVLAMALGRRLIRLQCYEGLDVAQAVYEWNYPRQMVEIRLAEAAGAVDRDAVSGAIYRDEFLLSRPVLEALRPHEEGPPVLLIDEIDRTDEPFEAYLLEVLSDWQVSIPELGTVTARRPPVVIITSNRTREVHDALKRRCFYHWVDFPSPEREIEIVERKVPGCADRLGTEIVRFVQTLRRQDLYKTPGVAETLDWAKALEHFNTRSLEPGIVDSSLGVLLKHQDDIRTIRDTGIEVLLKEAGT
ncbi:MAG: MoxR family ATPase [Alphaproteobacteria bacterium]|nr:MoxR family ATPase [Alphaproteobacteria bacterium]